MTAPRQRLTRLAAWAAWGYLAVALGAWLLVAVAGDRWWPGTLLLFGPRWPLLVPLPFVAALACLRPRLFAPVLAAAAVALGPVTGLCLPWRQLLPGTPAGRPLRVLTCNTDGAALNAEAFGNLLAETMPDVVALQEWSPEKKSAFWQPDWYFREGRDGVCLASRFPVVASESLGWEELGAPGGALRVDLATEWGPLTVFVLHLPTPRPGLEAVLGRRDPWAPELREVTEARWRAAAAVSRWAWRAGPDSVVAGDFNTPQESPIYRAYWSDRANAFALSGWGWGETKFTHRWGVRIDHVLAPKSWSCVGCRVGPDVGSDHRPLLADLKWPVAGPER